MIPNQYIREDLYRYEGKFSIALFFRYLLFTPGFRYTCILRLTKSATRFSRPIWILILRHYQIKYGIQIPWKTKIGRGFRIAHFGATVINPAAQIGNNFNIAQGAVIGSAPISRQKERIKTCPTIGDRVCVGANAIIIGGITIGDNCIIAPGAFVNKDMPPNTIALGNPATFHHKENASSSLITYELKIDDQY